MVNRGSFLVVVVLAWVLSACGQPPAGDSGAAATADPGATAAEATAPAIQATGSAVDTARLDREIYFYNWSDYIDEQILADFEAQYGVKVIMDVYDSNEDMLAKLRAGNSGYDVVAPSDYAVAIMIAEGLLAPLDKANIPNLSNIAPEYLDAPFDPGNQYSAPYFVGTSGIAYNKTSFATPPDSWASLFEPDLLETHRGKISMFDDEREAIGAALIYKGYSVNDTDPAHLAEAEQLLTTQKPYLAAYNSGDVNRKLAGEEVVLAQAWNGHASQAFNGLEDFPGNPNIGYVIPKEGGVIWMDSLVVVADTPRKYTAEVFINYLLDAQIAARNTDYVLYATPNSAAMPLLAEETRTLFDAGFGMPDPATVETLQWLERGKNNEVFSEIWTRIKSS